jgi:replicative DNA helicase
MDVEKLLIGKLIAERDILPIAEANITPEFFTGDANRAVFKAILQHNAQYGEVPTLRAIKADFPNYKFVKVEEPYEFLVDRIRENRRAAILDDAIGTSVEYYDKGRYEDAVNTLAKGLAQLNTETSVTQDLNLTDNAMERFEKYLAYKDFEGGLRGIPTGFDTIDRATQGMQNGQLILVVGPPKAGKSTTILLVAIAAWVFGLRPLVINFEMTNQELEERFDAIRAGISHARLRAGTLKKEEWDKLEKMLKSLDTTPDFLISSDAESVLTLTGVAAKIQQHEPDLLIVDGVYLMADEEGEPPGSPRALTNLTRGFKRMAKREDLPILISTQALSYKINKKTGITQDSIGYSSSFAQDADVVIGANNTEDDDIKEISIVIARNAPKMKTYVQWDWEIGVFQELDDDPFADGAEDGDPGF